MTVSSASRLPLPASLTVSFEFYPPKTDEQRTQLDRTAQKLKAYSPDYVSCTFGAGGSTLSYEELWSAVTQVSRGLISLGLGRLVGLLQLEDQRHQRFGDETPTEQAEATALVGAGAEGIGLGDGQGESSSRRSACLSRARAPFNRAAPSTAPPPQPRGFTRRVGSAAAGSSGQGWRG